MEFCALSMLPAQTEKDCSRLPRLLRSASILGFLSKEKQMAFCSACGSEVGGAAFCPKCGAAQGAPAAAAAPVPVGGAAAASPTDGMEENIAGLLCYVFGWVSGLIFLLIDKRPFVKFHAAQSIAFNIAFFAAWMALAIVGFVLTMITAMLHFPIGFITVFFFPIIGIAFLVLWIFLMFKAYNHEKYKLPIIGNMVEKMVK
jgi:uncharacterized membrane protein